MTFEDSNFQDLFETLMKLIKKYENNPEALRAINEELNRLYKKIPIYPGIIDQFIAKVVSPSDFDDLEPEERIIASLNNNVIISGKVKSQNSDKLSLSDCKKIEPPEESEEMSISIDDIKEINEIEHDMLAKYWSNLDFEVE